jgi:hypothetical protein
MKSDELVGLLNDNYFKRYLPAGGSAFKVVVAPSASASTSLSTSLTNMTDEGQAICLSLCGSTTKLHMMDKLFFGMSSEIDWDALILKFIQKQLLPDAELPTAHAIDLNALAVSMSLSMDQLKTRIAMAIRDRVSHDYGYCAEFRIALAQLCLGQMQVDGAPLSPYLFLIEEWLRGELGNISSLRGAMIFRKIQRNSARHMLYSTFRLLRQAGYRYVILLLDIARYLESVKYCDRVSGLYHSAAAALDLYELLRQSIDDVEQLDGTMVIVSAPDCFLTDDRRGIDTYRALKMRLWSDVKLKDTQNPLAPMIRLG